jgi:precorrin-2 C(20)-methyltransferase
MMTLGAVDELRRADVICLPQPSKARCRAYAIAVRAVPEVADKRCVCLDWGMTRDAAELERIHAEAYQRVRELCQEGQRVAFLTLGDPSVYSTFGYVAQRAQADGMAVEVVPGVASFTAAAACAGTMLCEGEEQLHVGKGRDMDALLALPGTKVIMKCGRDIGRVRDRLRSREDAGEVEVYAVSECGTDAQRVWRGAANIPDDAGYMTTIIVKYVSPGGDGTCRRRSHSACA